MIKIGDFAKLAGVSIKQLRHYDKLGIIKPCNVDGQTGYRYYSEAQISIINRALALKGMGFSLNEITNLMTFENMKVDQILERLYAKESETRDAIRAGMEKLTYIQSVIDMFKMEPQFTEIDVVLKELQPVNIASIRYCINDGIKCELMYRQLLEHLNACGVKAETPAFIIRHDLLGFGNSNEIEVAIPINNTVQITDKIQVRQLDFTGTAACLVYKGSSRGMTASYNTLMKWVDKTTTISGDPQEKYI